MQDKALDVPVRIFSMFIDETSDTNKLFVDYKKEADLETIAELVKQFILATRNK